MNLRQTRRHFYGNSNADFKTVAKENAGKPLDMNSVDYLSQPKKKTFNQIVELREKKSMVPEVLDATRSLYKVRLCLLRKDIKRSLRRLRSLGLAMLSWKKRNYAN
jgi:hypothetical protein